MMTDSGSNDYYYAHDHLYSPAALIDNSGDVVERYEYNAYGDCNVMDDSYVSRTGSSYGNPYLFTGRRLDVLDSGDLKIMYYRNRYYDPDTGRFLTHDPLGITPNAQQPNSFGIIGQFNDGSNLYEYAGSNVVAHSDPYGLDMTTPWWPCGVPDPPIIVKPPRIISVGSFKSCVSVLLGITQANYAMRTPGSCRDWFELRRSTGKLYKLRLRSGSKPMCKAGAYFWTWPLSRDIGACPVSCDNDSDTNALLIIHEVAHHFCGVLPGREDCANSAMEACVGDASW